MARRRTLKPGRAAWSRDTRVAPRPGPAGPPAARHPRRRHVRHHHGAHARAVPAGAGPSVSLSFRARMVVQVWAGNNHITPQVRGVPSRTKAVMCRHVSSSIWRAGPSADCTQAEPKQAASVECEGSTRGTPAPQPCLARPPWESGSHEGYEPHVRYETETVPVVLRHVQVYDVATALLRKYHWLVPGLLIGGAPSSLRAGPRMQGLASPVLDHACASCTLLACRGLCIRHVACSGVRCQDGTRTTAHAHRPVRSHTCARAPRPSHQAASTAGTRRRGFARASRC